MVQFVGTHPGKLDKKGRISVPAPFRAELEAAGITHLVFRASHAAACIEARSRPVFQGIVDNIQAMELYSPERMEAETWFISGSEMLKLDSEGRLVLPQDMIEEIGLGDQIAFLGKGDRFEIWDEATAKADLAEAKRQAREQRRTLPGMKISTALNTTPRSMP